jgi:hypothetical protein
MLNYPFALVRRFSRLVGRVSLVRVPHFPQLHFFFPFPFFLCLNFSRHWSMFLPCNDQVLNQVHLLNVLRISEGTNFPKPGIW